MPAWMIPAGLAAGSALSSYLAGKTARPGRYTRQNIMSDLQMRNANETGNRGMQMLRNPYEGFQPIAEQAKQQFYQQTIPSLAERFTAMGGHAGSNAQSSPSFASQLGGAGANLSNDLAAMQARYGQQQQQQGLNMLELAQRPQFENIYEHGGPTALSSGFGALGNMLGQVGIQGAKDWYQNYLNQPPAEAGTNNTSNAPLSYNQIQEQYPNTPLAAQQQSNMDQGVQAGMNFFRTPWNPNSSISNYNAPWQMQHLRPGGIESLRSNNKKPGYRSIYDVPFEAYKGATNPKLPQTFRPQDRMTAGGYL